MGKGLQLPKPKVIVCSGSREWDDYDFIRARLQMVQGPSPTVRCGFNPKTRQPRGADLFVDKACRAIGLATEYFPADWDANGKAAGFIRNEEMFEDGQVDHFIAFWIGESHGTRDAVRRAYQHAVPWIEIHRRPE